MSIPFEQLPTYIKYLAPILANALVISLLSLAVCAMILIGLCFVFMKAKAHGWAAIIPFYSDYVLYEITWGKGWLFLLELIPIVGIVMSILTYIKLGNCFNKGSGFKAGLVLAPYVFLPILGFGKSEYRGPMPE